MCKAINVAKYIINTIHIDNLKLQKLLYYCQAVHLVLRNKPLFNDAIEAWMYGPVVPDVYKKYKKYGLETIPYGKDDFLQLSDSEMRTIGMVIKYYGDMTGVQLVSKTHLEEPWKNVYKPEKRNIIITQESIYKYFKDQFEFDETEI